MKLGARKLRESEEVGLGATPDAGGPPIYLNPDLARSNCRACTH